MGTRYVAWLSVVFGMTSCQLAEGPETARLPSCFEGGKPQPRAGKALLRLRWVHQADDAFMARSVALAINERQVFASKDESKLEQARVHLLEVELEPGAHRLASVVNVSGRGSGLFAHLQDYSKELKNEQDLSVAAGAASCVTIVVAYRDGISLPVEERPVAVLVEERAP